MSKVANILFPADYFDKKAPDGAMRVEYESAYADSRLDVGLFDLELFEQSGKLALTRPFINESMPLIYRGWMMKPEQYSAFFGALREKRLHPTTGPDAYEEFHMFPLAYARHGVLNMCAPRLVAFPGKSADAEVVNRTFAEFMVKDYVKSVKGTTFPVSFGTPVSQERMDEIVEEFARHRGDLFTAGIVCKEYVDLARYGGATNEWRAFYLGGGLLNVCRNSNQPAIAPKPPDGLVSACSNLGSPYYTVDFAERTDGSWIVVETGDGQVSGLAAAQDPAIYYQVLADALERGAASDEPSIRRTISAPTGAAILMGEPLRGWSVDDMREWLGDDPEEARLAEAFSLVHAKEGYLMDVSEDDGTREDEFEEWWGYQKELYDKIIEIQDQRGDRYGTSFGMMAAVMPFMYRNRYADACGWWVKRDDPVDEGRRVSITNTLMNRREKGLLASLIGKTLDAVEYDSMFDCIPDRDWDDAAFEAMGLVFGDDYVLLTNAEEVAEDFGGESEDVTAFHVGRREWFGPDYWFIRKSHKQHGSMTIGQRIEDVLLVEEREQHGVGAETDSFYSYTKAVCFLFEGGDALLCYRDTWFGEHIHFALGRDAMEHLPEPGDEIDWDEGDGFWMRRAVVSLREWPDEKVVDSGGRRE